MSTANYCWGIAKDKLCEWSCYPFDARHELNAPAPFFKNSIILYIDNYDEDCMRTDVNVFLKSYFNRSSKYFQKLLRKIYENR
jgi:hypothetical protein